MNKNSSKNEIHVPDKCINVCSFNVHCWKQINNAIKTGDTSFIFKSCGAMCSIEILHASVELRCLKWTRQKLFNV